MATDAPLVETVEKTASDRHLSINHGYNASPNRLSASRICAGVWFTNDSQPAESGRR
jgi:hypothetical protein